MVTDIRPMVPDFGYDKQASIKEHRKVQCTHSCRDRSKRGSIFASLLATWACEDPEEKDVRQKGPSPKMPFRHGQTSLRMFEEPLPSCRSGRASGPKERKLLRQVSYTNSSDPCCVPFGGKGAVVPSCVCCSFPCLSWLPNGC